MIVHGNPRVFLIALAGLFAVTGCTSHDIVTSASRPGKFRLYNCEQLDNRGAEVLKRERELNELMQKARQGAGGEIAVAIASMWKPLGVQVELVNQEWKVYLETRDKKDFDIARAAWIGDYADPINFLDMFKSDAGARNDAGYNNPKFDELLKTAGATVDPQKRLEILAQAEKVFLDDNAMIPIYHYTTKHMLSPKLAGWEFNILDIHPGRFLSLKS